MKRMLMSAAIMAAMIAPASLAAQSGYGSGQEYHGSQNGHGWNGNEFWRDAPRSTWERISFLQQRIDRSVRDGSLDSREGRRANATLRQIRLDAQHQRRHNGTFRHGQEAALQVRLDDLSRNLRWQRHNGYNGYNDSWSSGYDRDPYTTDYDAMRYYRNGPQYQERRLSAQDEVYRGSDGRYYCKRNDGTTGLVVGAVAGGVVGNVIDGGHNRVAGTLIGGALGALAGRAIDQSSDVRCT